MSVKEKIAKLGERIEHTGKEPDQMDLLMRTIKAVHSATTNESFTSGEELKKQRVEMERFSKLVTPSFAVSVRPFMVEEIPCEWVNIQGVHRKDKVILYCHGGGYTCGGLGYARILASKLAYHTGCEVVSFEYRLAPEHPYPAAIEDGMALWNYLMQLGYGAKDIILAGDSAGGNLALELCLELNKSERFLPKALVLMSPFTDMRAEGASYKTCATKDPLLTYNYVLSVRRAYAGEDADFADVKYSPLLADFEGFPPTLIQVGSHEILKSDSVQLAKKMTKCGCLTKLEIYQGGWHVFQQMPLIRASNALDKVNDFLNTIL